MAASPAAVRVKKPRRDKLPVFMRLLLIWQSETDEVHRRRVEGIDK